ncbi:hypothetical protein [Streptomyces sp. NPDC001165]|uniref:hypothetical protein n=1 Tax=Streptomyces sp. NPDC001165 TaxID=3364546 RepID=UPI003682635B
MPTYEMSHRFASDLAKLTPAQRRRFRRVLLEEFVPDLESGLFRPGLRIRGLQAARGVFELTWGPNGRATWAYGPEHLAGARHVVWRRIGSHAILGRP